jgi:hypothetical protein
MSEEGLWQAAYHEAGHAVAGWVEGLKMEGASIEPQGDSLGRVNYNDVKFMEEYPETLRRHLVSTFAGVEADKFYSGQPIDPDDPNTDADVPGSDWSTLLLLTAALAPDPESQVVLQEQAQERAERLLRENWHAVGAVAEALLRHRTLECTDLYQILEGTGCPRGKPDIDYEGDQLNDRYWKSWYRYDELTKEGDEEGAQRVYEEFVHLQSEIEELKRLDERQE